MIELCLGAAQPLLDAASTVNIELKPDALEEVIVHVVQHKVNVDLSYPQMFA